MAGGQTLGQGRSAAHACPDLAKIRPAVARHVFLWEPFGACLTDSRRAIILRARLTNGLPTGRSAVWLARTVRVREVASSNLAAPTIRKNDGCPSRAERRLGSSFRRSESRHVGTQKPGAIASRSLS